MEMGRVGRNRDRRHRGGKVEPHQPQPPVAERGGFRVGREHRERLAAILIIGENLIDHMAGGIFVDAARSEEHTSELQSLMRISYAVFCLKKKKTQTTIIR